VINLSKADLLLALNEGKRATWAKLSAIQVGDSWTVPAALLSWFSAWHLL
jgi:hypothetical protein